MQKGDIAVLNQLVRSLEETILVLEQAYLKKDFENFQNTKKLILSLQKKISEIIGGK